MNARLKTSLESAESLLSEEAQDKLALLVESFALTHGGSAQDHFSEAELAELREIADEPFKEADPKAVREIFERNGVTLKHEL